MRTNRCLLLISVIATMTLFSVATGCSGSDATILPNGTDLRVGDVVFRRGTGAASLMVLSADRGGNYSHVGIVVDSCGKLMVAHAVPDEPDFPGDSDRVKLDSPELFFIGYRAAIGEVCRHSDAEAARRAAAFALDAWRRHVPFDHDYDDSDTSRMYCCQLVEWAYRRAGCEIVTAEPHTLQTVVMGDITCRLPSDLLHSPSLTSVARF